METEKEGAPGESMLAKELEAGELEEGEMVEEKSSECVTKSPLPPATQTGPAAVGSGTSGGQVEAMSLQAARAANTTNGLCGGHAARSTPTAPRPPGRAPPTAPRALRLSQANNSHVQSTPLVAPSTAMRPTASLSPSREDERDLRPGRAPPTAPRAMRPSHSNGAQSSLQSSPRSPSNDTRGAGEHRAPSPPRNLRPAKRRRPEPAPMPHVMPSARDMEFSRMEQLVRVHEKRIHDMEWEICEWAARLHICKTRGPDSDWDIALREKITRKYWKMKHPEEVKDNWRLAEISDLSDEEAPRSPRHATPQPAPAKHRPQSVPIGDEAGEAGEIFTMYDIVADGPDAEFSLDDDHFAAESDLLAAGKALKLAGKKPKGASAGLPSAATELSLEELLAKTVFVQYGLRFSYTLRLWQRQGSWLPAPLGRFGQPFWKGSAWEDFDPRRIFDKSRPDYVELASRKFLELAEDASRIAFVFRSATQRQVVSLALQHDLGLTHGNEPDMVTLCRTNPARLLTAIRRQYRRGARNIFYAEYDASDIGNHISVTLSGPQKVQDGLRREDYVDQKRAWLLLVNVFILEWLPLFYKQLPDPLEVRADVQPWPVSVDLVNRNIKDDELFEKFWYHLTANALPRRSLIPGGEFHDYIRRSRIMHEEVERLSLDYQARTSKEQSTNQDAKRKWVADRLPYEPIPAGFPVLRVKLTKQKVEALAVKYRERGNEKEFIPL